MRCAETTNGGRRCSFAGALEYRGQVFCTIHHPPRRLAKAIARIESQKATHFARLKVGVDAVVGRKVRELGVLERARRAADEGRSVRLSPSECLALGDVATRAAEVSL